MDAVISVHDLTLCYRKHPAVHHLTGAFLKGRATAIIGPNGAGKSTLMKGLAGLMKPDHGTVAFLPNTTTAYLPQRSSVESDFPISVFDFVALGLWAKIKNGRAICDADQKIVMSALKTVGLTDFVSRNLETLSGGQMQRALFARVIVQDASVILLDEPFTAIDARTTADLLTLMCDWLQEGRTVIAVLHDMKQVENYFSQCMLLARELVAWGETAQVNTVEHWQKADMLAEGWVSNAPICERRDA